MTTPLRAHTSSPSALRGGSACWPTSTAIGIVTSALGDALARFRTVTLDAHVIMPNHLHIILLLEDQSTPAGVPDQHFALGQVVRALKATVARGLRKAGQHDFAWQRNYYERVIRNDQELNSIRQYIFDNPLQWDVDHENPLRTGTNPIDEWLYPSAGSAGRA